jgi:Phage integrase, N-terminal SAM-like domain
MPGKNPFMATEVVAQAASPGKPKKLLEQVRDLLRLKHYSLRTERCYCDWIERFIRSHGKRHPRDLGEEELSAFLTHLARDGQVASSTQNQALSALLFLYKGVLKQEIGWLDGVERAKRPVRQPLVLTSNAVALGEFLLRLEFRGRRCGAGATAVIAGGATRFFDTSTAGTGTFTNTMSKINRLPRKSSWKLGGRSL